MRSGESADDLTEIEAEIVLEATDNTSAIVRLLCPSGGRLATGGRSPVAWTGAIKCFLPKMPSFRPRAITSAMDCVKASISQLDCPGIGSDHIPKMGQLGNRHCNSGICPEVRIQCCHCHAGAGFSVRLAKEIEDLTCRLAKLHPSSPMVCTAG